MINGIISTDSIIKINLSKTFHIFESESSNNLPFVAGAEARLYQDDQFLFVLEEDENGYYTKPDFYSLLNHSYRVEVAKSGYDDVSGETSIPTPTTIQSFDTLSVVEDNDEYYGMELTCILKYLDSPDVGNYYRLDCYMSYLNIEGQEVKYKQYIYINENEEYLFDKSYGYLLWSDHLSDGNEVNVKFGIYLDYYYFEYDYNLDTSTVTYSIVLSSMSEDYYKYDKTRSIFFESGGADNPFAEPVLIYSNIKNGYGIFGGYSSDTVSFQYSYNYLNQ